MTLYKKIIKYNDFLKEKSITNDSPIFLNDEFNAILAEKPMREILEMIKKSKYAFNAYHKYFLFFNEPINRIGSICDDEDLDKYLADKCIEYPEFKKYIQDKSLEEYDVDFLITVYNEYCLGSNRINKIDDFLKKKYDFPLQILQGMDYEHFLLSEDKYYIGSYLNLPRFIHDDAHLREEVLERHSALMLEWIENYENEKSQREGGEQCQN